MGEERAGPGSFRALAVLRAKEGELTALRQLRSGRFRQQFHAVQPLLRMDPGRPVDGDHIDDLAGCAAAHALGGRPVMIDASDLDDPAATMRTFRDKMGMLPDSCRFIPVVRATDPRSYVDLLGALADECDCGAALRYVVEHTPPGDITAAITAAIAALRHEREAIDLIIDVGYLPNRRTARQRAEQVTALVSSHPCLQGYRTTSVVAGSVPKSLRHVGRLRQVRHEEELWRGVATGSTRKDLRFGDFGVVHPVPPKRSGGRFTHSTLRYAVNGFWLFFRQSIEDHLDEATACGEDGRTHTFRLISRELVADTEEYFGPTFSWGDHQLASSANGNGEKLGTTSTPVAFATSHHLAYLAERPLAA
ncbi:hypothetical protein GCM10012275_13600 [Longimycelium tulufanense]|uniref:T4 beta protein n=1 Tax=Longimycelium tulufanense TaxID=907463 RepID=A0A8J3CBN7_9PSEU|nr:hypothetical protein [Longimycelium tulufanense]GGM43868.1 hypothetical protein GCM10012275_13600 [Longimycelium tulufanense]